MESQQAQNLVKQQTSALESWVVDRCDHEKHLIPLALLHTNRYLSEKNWEKVCQYDGEPPFDEFLRQLVEDALENFFYGVWFGECAEAVNYWLNRYKISNESKRQDAEDYIKNHLAKDNFARFKSYNRDKTVRFRTYISMVIRNLLIDFLRKKTPLTETMSVGSEDVYSSKNAINDMVESNIQQHLEEIGQWFFASPLPNEEETTIHAASNIPDAVKLDHKERLFLRAMYKEGMTAEEAGQLPGFNMGKWQAHNYHRKLKKRIKKLLEMMGYKNLQSLLYPN